MASSGIHPGESPPLIATRIPSPDLYRIPRKPIAGNSSTKLGTTRASVSVTTDELSSEATKAAGSDPSEHLIQDDGTRSTGHERYVEWGIFWKTPLLIVFWALVGISWAIGHHFYYQSLDGTRAGSSARQSWPVRFGTAFAFLVVASLRAACDTAYQQYIWTLFKRKALSLDTLDRLFSVLSDPTAFMSWEFLTHAKIAFLIAIVCWSLPLSGITPPATLSVVPGFHNESRPLSLASLDWNSPNFFDEEDSIAQPSSDVLQIATLAAQSMAVIPPAPPAANSSFHVQYYGPTLQCNTANSSQQSNLEYYAKALANSSLLAATRGLYESGNLTWGEDGPPGMTAPLMNVYSAFSPYAGEQGWLSGSSPLEDGSYDYAPDAYNNWIADVPPGSVSGVALPEWAVGSGSFTTQQLWIQTSDKGLVCIMGNASFDVDFEFVDAAMTVAAYSISLFEPFWMPLDGNSLYAIVPANLTTWPEDFWNPSKAYMAVYLALSSLLNGNISTTLTNSFDENWFDAAQTEFDGNVTIYDGSSKILQYGLSACDEFVKNFWNGDNAIGIGQNGPVSWRQAAAAMDGIASNDSSNAPGSGEIIGWELGSERFTNISNNLFTKPPWMCRNASLPKAIEDLANNITISMLSSASLVKPNPTTVPVLTFPIQNIYRYDSRNLILSYSIAVVFTILSAFVGFFALHYNGVAHSTAFSAMIATTRNRELDEVSRGHSLGALPLEYTEMKVRFGTLLGYGEKRGDDWDAAVDVKEGGAMGARRLGFGAAEKIGGLRKRGRYV